MNAAPALLILLMMTPLAAAKDVVIHAGTAADGSLYFRPATVVVDEGETVRLTLVNDDAATPHDWALLSFGGRDIEAYVKGGESKTITFTADEAGEYRIVCQVVGHKQKGMEGAFVVNDKLLVPGPDAALGAVAVALLAILIRRRLA